MSTLRVFSFAIIAVLSVGFYAFADVAEEALKEAKCPVSGEAVSKDAHASWKEGTVHFCCEKCQAAFEKDSEKHAAKANHQLVVTKQYEQKACPFSGSAIKKETAVKVDGASVAFCCNNCKGKAEKLEGDAKVAELFSDKAFEKAKYVKVEAEKK